MCREREKEQKDVEVVFWLKFIFSYKLNENY